MDFPIIINWVSPLSFLGASGVILIFIQYFHEIPPSKLNSTFQARSAAFHLGLFCLRMSHKRDARLKRVKIGHEMYIFL